LKSCVSFLAISLQELLRGRTIFITGAAGGVGFYAAQIAKLRGARVIGTVGSHEKARVLADVGINDAIHYKTEPVAERILELTQGRWKA
jgi:NADPH2:quinone reductase